MHIGFRYHVASLVAVFFSLVLGMLIGSTLFQDDRLVEEQGHIIADLENRFRATEARTQLLQDNLDMANQRLEVTYKGWNRILPTLARDLLTGRSFVFLTTADDRSYERYRELVEIAGGVVRSEVTVEESLTALPEQTSMDDNPIVVVWVEDSVNPELQEFLATLKDNNVFVSYLQPLTSEYTLESLGEQSLVIDMADTPIGEVAFLAGVARELTGNYGVKRGASSLLPALEGIIAP